MTHYLGNRGSGQLVSLWTGLFSKGQFLLAGGCPHTRGVCGVRAPRLGVPCSAGAQQVPIELDGKRFLRAVQRLVLGCELQLQASPAHSLHLDAFSLE